MVKRGMKGDPGRTKANKRARACDVPEAPFYDFEPLIHAEEGLKKYASINAQGKWRIDFSSRSATFELTRAILKHHFHLTFFLPPGHLVPTVPNRVQYLLWAASLLGKPQATKLVTVIDIGTGPSCIYPLLGSRLFPRWRFIGTDTDEEAVRCARRNCDENALKNVEVLQVCQAECLLPNEVLIKKPTLTICNPPFYETISSTGTPPGTSAQMAVEGGELGFLCRLASESRRVPQAPWFTSLIGRKVDCPRIVSFLRSPLVRALYVKTAELSQGGRTTRWAVAWSFGEENSVVNVDPETSSLWRLVLTIKPGRQYANELGRGDLADVICSILLTLGWTMSDHTPRSQCLAFKGTTSGRWQHSELSVTVAEGLLCGEFKAYVKTEDKGQMRVEDFEELGRTLTQRLRIMLNESSAN